MRVYHPVGVGGGGPLGIAGLRPAGTYQAQKKTYPHQAACLFDHIIIPAQKNISFLNYIINKMNVNFCQPAGLIS